MGLARGNTDKDSTNAPPTKQQGDLAGIGTVTRWRVARGSMNLTAPLTRATSHSHKKQIC